MNYMNSQVEILKTKKKRLIMVKNTLSNKFDYRLILAKTHKGSRKKKLFS